MLVTILLTNGRKESLFWFEVVPLALEYGADPEFYILLQSVSRDRRTVSEGYRFAYLVCRWRVDDTALKLHVDVRAWKEMSNFIEANGGRVPFRQMVAEFWKAPNCDAILDLIDKYLNYRPGQTTNDVLKDSEVVHSASVRALGNDIVSDQEARENRVEQVSPSADNSEGPTVERPNPVAQ
jgi:hypothetical protein